MHRNWHGFWRIKLAARPPVMGGRAMHRSVTSSVLNRLWGSSLPRVHGRAGRYDSAAQRYVVQGGISRSLKPEWGRHEVAHALDF